MPRCFLVHVIHPFIHPFIHPSIHPSIHSSIHPPLYQTLPRQLMNKSYGCTHILSKYCCPTNYRYQLVLAGMADPSLPWLFRMRFANLMKSLWIDRPPFYTPVLPRHIYAARADDALVNSHSRRSAETIEFEFIPDNFVVLQV